MIKVRVPGSVMLFGEHAVLHGHNALVAAVDRYVTLELQPIAAPNLVIQSTLGSVTLPLATLKPVAPFTFVIAACQQYQSHFRQGVRLSIESEFSSRVGLGSSAAVTVASCAALDVWLHGAPPDLERVGRLARSAVYTVQGLGSGADVLASTYGGALLVNAKKNSYLPFVLPYAMTLAYCGYKTPTVALVDALNERFALVPDTLGTHLYTLGECANLALQAFKAQDDDLLAKSARRHQEVMQALGLTTPELDVLINTYAQLPGVCAAKISGSGLGDCIVAFGEFSREAFLTRQDNIPVALSSTGVSLI